MFNINRATKAQEGIQFAICCISVQEKIAALLIQNEQIIVRINALIQQTQLAIEGNISAKEKVPFSCGILYLLNRGTLTGF
jgi:hypothetical protein